ncbi:MAG: type I 3-dehydroquinate dehydratase [Treponema sp.]|jgi:3-dehydroquinate dehydratase/shikimate dehydrogenase|nr:type I 3-dehydroquinate dehydratase [Treponema sp.]
MAKICLCLTGRTLARDLEILKKFRKYIDVAELRADYLDPDERFHIRKFPAMAGLPVILTVRRERDGGKYTGAESARITLLSNGLAFAEADRRMNFAYVDIEEDLDVASLEEAARAFGTKIIRSYHNFNGVDTGLASKLRGLLRVGDEIAKVAVMPLSLKDVKLVYQAARQTKNIEKILLCMGDYGVNTRILAGYMGCHLSYTTVKGEADIPIASSGQLDPRELSELYRFKEITPKTKIFAATGFPLKVSVGPKFFNPVFNHEKIDAVYIPIPSDSIEFFLQLGTDIGLSGASITFPYTEAVLPYLTSQSDDVDSIGACNVIVKEAQGWQGYNTDAKGFSDALLDIFRLKDLHGKKICIIGAGGMARAAASEVFRLKGKALILNRTELRARDLAVPYNFAWGRLDRESLKMMKKYTDIIIQATSVGMEPDIEQDPLWFYEFSGKELVADLIYKPEKTRCLARAEQAGCKILNGYDILLRQAQYQYKYFMGKEFSSSLINKLEF